MIARDCEVEFMWPLRKAKCLCVSDRACMTHRPEWIGEEWMHEPIDSKLLVYDKN